MVEARHIASNGDAPNSNTALVDTPSSRPAVLSAATHAVMREQRRGNACTGAFIEPLLLCLRGVL